MPRASWDSWTHYIWFKFFVSSICSAPLAINITEGKLRNFFFFIFNWKMQYFSDLVCNLQRFFASLPFWLRTSEHAWDYIGSYNSCEQFLPDNPVFIILQAAFSQRRILTRYKTIIISYFLTLELDILIGYITLFNYTIIQGTSAVFLTYTSLAQTD